MINPHLRLYLLATLVEIVYPTFEPELSLAIDRAIKELLEGEKI